METMLKKEWYDENPGRCGRKHESPANQGYVTGVS
jgi:hypothetical protein